MKIRVLIKEDGFLQGYAIIGGMPDWLEIEVSEEIVNDLNENYKKYYLKDGELIKKNKKPNNFHFWDSKTNEWIYDVSLEINSLEEELGSLELEIYNKQNELKELKENNKIFAAKKLEKENIELDKTYQEKLKRYEELAE